MEGVAMFSFPSAVQYRYRSRFTYKLLGIDVADSIMDIGNKNLEMMLLAKHGGGVVSELIRFVLPELKLQVMEHQMELSLFAKSMTQLYSQPIKDQYEEELHPLISISNTLILMNGWKSESLKATSTDNLLTYISVLSLVISLCVSSKAEIKKQGSNGPSYSKNVKLLASRISSLKGIQTKLIQMLTSRIA